MKTSKVLRLCVVSLVLLPMVVLAETLSSADLPSPGCQTKLIDLTDPELAQKLANRKFEALGPMTIRYQADSQTSTKISSREFVTLDDQGNAVVIVVRCNLSCSSILGGCAQQGCEVHANGQGCTEWNCGLGCSGQCVETTNVE